MKLGRGAGVQRIVDRPERRLERRPRQQLILPVEPEPGAVWEIERPGAEAVGQIDGVQALLRGELHQGAHQLLIVGAHI